MCCGGRCSREQREQGAPLLEAVMEHIPGCQRVRVMDDEEFTLIAGRGL